MGSPCACNLVPCSAQGSATCMAHPAVEGRTAVCTMGHGAARGYMAFFLAVPVLALGLFRKLSM